MTPFEVISLGGHFYFAREGTLSIRVNRPILKGVMMRRHVSRCVAFASAVFVVVLGGVASLQVPVKGGEDETGPYESGQRLAATVGASRLHLGFATGCVRGVAQIGSFLPCAAS